MVCCVAAQLIAPEPMLMRMDVINQPYWYNQLRRYI